MGALSTIYDVRMRYMLEDKASKGARGLDSALRSAGRSSSFLQRALGYVGAAAVGAFGARAAGKALIGFNSGMEQARIRMAGLMQMNLGGSFEGQLKQSAALVAELQQRSKVTTLTTEQMVEFLGNTIQPLTQAGMKADKLAEFTQRAMVAAKAFGDEGLAELDIQQALNQNVTVRDRFMMKLLGTVKMTQEEFNKLDKSARLETMQRALAHPAIQKMAEQQAKSFEGVTSTLKDNIQILMGKVGLPLFKAITHEIRQWNLWIDHNGKRLDVMAKNFAHTLVEGFRYVKQIAGFLVDHKDLLIMLAKAWLVGKVAKGITGGLIGGAANLQGLIGSFGTRAAVVGAAGAARAAGAAGIAGRMMPSGAREIDLEAELTGTAVAAKEATARFGGFSAGLKAFAAAGGLQALAVGAQLAADEIDREMDVRMNETDRLGGVRTDTRDVLDRRDMRNMSSLAAQNRLLGSARQVGFLSKDGSINERAILNASVKAYGFGSDAYKNAQDTLRALKMAVESERTGAINTFRLLQMSASDFARALTRSGDMLVGFGKQVWAATGGALYGTFFHPKVSDEKVASKAAKVNVTIQRIEVQSDDPDRFVQGMIDAFHDSAKNPSSALAAFREG